MAKQDLARSIQQKRLRGSGYTVRLFQLVWIGSHQSGYLEVVVLPPLRDLTVEIRLDIDGNRRQASLPVDSNQVF